MPSKKESDNRPKVENSKIFEWKSPGRPFRKRAKQYFLTALLMMLLVEIILFLFSEYLLMAVVLALVFVAFALSSVPPKEFYYKMSNEGIQIEDAFFLWKELYDFYFIKKDNVETIRIRTEAYLPGELTITFNPEDREKIQKFLVEYLSFREYVKPSFTDKAGDWLSKNFPLEEN